MKANKEEALFLLKSSIWKQISNTHKSSRSRRDSPSYSNNILFSLFLANVHFFTFRLKTIISNEMEQHVFRFTNKLSPKTSQDASRQYISLYPPVFLFSFYLSFSLSFQISAWVYNIQIVDANNECFMEIFIHSGLKAFFTFFFFFIILFYLKRNTTRNFCAVVRGHKVDAMCSINTVMNVIWIFLLKSSR